MSATSEVQYRYQHFTRQHVVENIAFVGGVQPGDRLPDFDLPTTEGNRIRKHDFLGQRPVLLVFASLT